MLEETPSFDILGRLGLSSEVARENLPPAQFDALNQFSAVLRGLAEQEFGSDWGTTDQKVLKERLMPKLLERVNEIPGAAQALSSWVKATTKIVNSGQG